MRACSGKGASLLCDLKRLSQPERSSPLGSANCSGMTGWSIANRPSVGPEACPTLSPRLHHHRVAISNHRLVSLGRWPSHVSLEGFGAQKQKAPDDAFVLRVPTALPATALLPRRLCSHSQLRLFGQPPAALLLPFSVSPLLELGAKIETPSIRQFWRLVRALAVLDMPSLRWPCDASDRQAYGSPDPLRAPPLPREHAA